MSSPPDNSGQTPDDYLAELQALRNSRKAMVEQSKLLTGQGSMMNALRIQDVDRKIDALKRGVFRVVYGGKMEADNAG
jgi:3-methyladenine DNA glycosylase Mpg